MPRSTVTIDLAGDAPLSRDLAAGGVFVPGCTLQIADECDLVVLGANRRVSLPARVVYVDHQRGAGLELIGFSTAMRDQLAELAPVAAAPPTDDVSGGDDLAGGDDDLAVPVISDGEDELRTLPVSTGVRDAVDLDLEPPRRRDELDDEDAPGPLADDDFAPDPFDDEPASTLDDDLAPESLDDDFVPDPFDDDAPDDLAVPVADESEDNRRTVPTSTGVHDAVDLELAPALPRADTADDLALAMDAEAERAMAGFIRRPATRDLLESDPALAIGEADAAFADAAASPSRPGAIDATGFFDIASPMGLAMAASAERTGARLRSLDDDRLASTEHRDVDHAGPGHTDAGLEPPEHADAQLGAARDAGAEPAEPEPTVPGMAALGAAETEATDDADAATDDANAETDDADAAGERRGLGARIPRNVHERLRGLNLVAQLKVATSGELHERIVLERLYGKNVWETLLRNPRLTPPEVSRIARYGSLPRILLEIILANSAWLAVPEVRRALLSNPRLGTDQIAKVLRLVPKHELRLAAIQTAYPHAVRNAAKMLLRSE